MGPVDARPVDTPGSEQPPLDPPTSGDAAETPPPPAVGPLSSPADPASPRLDALRSRITVLLGRTWMPPILLWIVVILSTGARVFHLDQPGETSPGAGFIFDEKYYVNAARVIAGVTFPAGDTYNGDSPAGTDPNGEHPQLAKMIIAAGIRVFGDNPIGWRLGAVLFGSLTILALYRLVRVAGGSGWLALGASCLVAIDNLMLVHGRIAVLDIYLLPLMIMGVAWWLEGRPLLAGGVIGVAMCMKFFAIYAIFVIVLVEVMRALAFAVERRKRGGALPEGRWFEVPARRIVPLGLCIASFSVAFLGLLSVLDAGVHPYHDHHPVSTGNPFAHISFVQTYGSSLTSPDGPKGIASYPLQFWYDVEPANYYTNNSIVSVDGKVTAINTVVAYIGMVNPVILILALPAFLASIWMAITRRDALSILCVAWYPATWFPAEVYSLVYQRTCYLYYMVMVMPGIAIAVARMVGHRLVPRPLIGLYVGLLIAGFVILYPFRTLGGL